MPPDRMIVNNDALSKDTKVNDLYDLDFEIAFSDSAAAGGIVFHKYILIFPFKVI